MNNKYDFNQAFDGGRMTKMFRASVQANGRLNIPPDAARAMGISLEKALLICPMGEKDLAVAVISKEDERGFEIKKSGPYFYVVFKSLLTELQIDFRNNTVVYDIIELADHYGESAVYKFNRRMIPHEQRHVEAEDGVCEDIEAAAEVAEGTGVSGEVAAVHGEGFGGAGG